MLSLIFLPGVISAVVSMKTNECAGKPDNYGFKQDCNECWCYNGQALCTNKGCLTLIGNEEEENNFEDDNALREARHLRKANAIGTQAWDLGKKYPKPQPKEKLLPVTPYPPSFRDRYHLRPVPGPSEDQKYPEILEYRKPDHGGLNVVDEAIIMHPYGRYRLLDPRAPRSLRYPPYGYPPYSPRFPSPSNAPVGYYLPPLFYHQYG